MEDVMFFEESDEGKITKLPWSTPYEQIMAVASATLKLNNKKMVGKACSSIMRQTVIHFCVRFTPSGVAIATF